uniref:glutathione transferase n=1 Tax=Ciona intestinalis TaxID=7719 RepID=F7AHD2_CIOIN
MTKMLLGYWDLRGLGEPIRLMLEYAGFEYEDKRYQFIKEKEDYSDRNWTEPKYSLGFDYPNLPYLIDGDVKVTESWAIMKYLSRKFEKLGPENEEERIKCDVTEGVVQDVRKQFYDLCYSATFVTSKEEFLQEIAPKLEQLQRSLEHHTWLCGTNLKYVDFAFFEFLDHLRVCLPGSLDKYPLFVKSLKRFDSLEKIAAYKTSEKFQKCPVNGPMAQAGGQ